MTVGKLLDRFTRNEDCHVAFVCYPSKEGADYDGRGHINWFRLERVVDTADGEADTALAYRRVRSMEVDHFLIEDDILRVYVKDDPGLPCELAEQLRAWSWFE